MQIFMRWSVIPAAAVLASACTGVVSENDLNPPAYYLDGDFERAAAKGAVRTVVIGNPFSTQSGTFGDYVRALMKDQAGDIRASFVAVEGANTTKPYKVVVVFNPRENVDYRTICKAEGQTPTTSGNSGQTSVVMVFCDGSNFKSGIKGRASGIKGQNDPKFVSLVQSVADAMIPPYGLEQQLRGGDD